jgi:hypothetical protein
MKRSTVAAFALLAACVNPYTKFYQGLQDARTSPAYVADAGPLQLYSSSNVDRDGVELLRRGYFVIGTSAFNAGMNRVSRGQLEEQANQVGAQVVLVYSRYTNSVTTAIPLTLPASSTTTSTGTATVYGSGGSATVYGTGTSTTYGTQTVVIPHTVARGDFYAVYFARSRTRLGIIPVALDDSTRARLQTNFGVRVLVVVEGSPAFNADVLPGDIVQQIGDDRVASVEHFSQLLVKYEGQHVAIRLDRAGRTVEKQLTIQRLPPPAPSSPRH